MAEQKEMILVPLRGVTLFPGVTLHFEAGRRSSVAALMNADGKELFFVTQKDIAVEYPDKDDMYTVGVVGKVRYIRQYEETGFVTVTVDGLYRARLDDIVSRHVIYKARIEPLKDDVTLPDGVEEHDRKTFTEAALFSVKRFYDGYNEFAPNLSLEAFSRTYESNDLSGVVDYIASSIMLSVEERQQILSTLNIYTRSELMCLALAKETRIVEIDGDIQKKVNERMDKNQREYYLREELKVISDELGDIDEDGNVSFEGPINKSLMSDEAKQKLLTEAQRLKRMSSSSSDANVIHSYIEKCLEIPWGKYTKENTSLQKAKRILEKDHYGLKDVKQRIVEMLASLIISPDIKGQIICLAGPPGVGKTSIAKSIARATNRKYTRISLGGVRDEAEIRGHRKTYIGSMPGRIINALIEAGSMNPLILLDEIDKLSVDIKGDPAAALLEVLDSEQNFSFRDNYIELPVDLSRVLFITTANDKHAIPEALRDRMEIIDLPSYTREEKFSIAKKHLIPKQLKQHGLTKNNIRINDAAVRSIIDGYTREAGVRILERKIAAVMRKEAVRLAEGNEEKLEVTDKNIEEYLGIRKYRPEENTHEDCVGVVNGLAWTAVGGEILQAEVAVLKGNGKIECTGSLGDVMKESVKTAISFVRSRADKYGINPEFYKENDIHIHFPEGAVPKDGPSAGVTVTTALVSALTNIAVRGDVAMTGEVTLTGRVLAIGGLREKSMAAYSEGIPTVIIPHANIPDIEEIDDVVKNKINFIPVKTVDEVIEIALTKSPVCDKVRVEKKESIVKTEPKERSVPKKINHGITCKKQLPNGESI